VIDEKPLQKGQLCTIVCLTLQGSAATGPVCFYVGLVCFIQQFLVYAIGYILSYS